MGIVYAVWSSLGTTLIVFVGALFLNEPLTLAKVTGAALVIAGVVILNLGGAH
ncbi:SMR family transporter [Streptomyces sp. NPDC019990]|uniref:DMT family transporter n=1 Tax=Streptomyces sp. NPDC019990 TaxID=3154693 RepID=UPI0034066507